MHRVHVIDSHTGGEPTRVVVAGGPDLGRGPLARRREAFRTEFDRFRSAVVTEPRGSDAMVGALLVEPHEPNCSAGAVFFNNVGVIGMCGHGTMGLAVTLAHLGRLAPGSYRLDTPVGAVGFEYHGGPTVTVTNVPSYRHAAGVTVEVDGVGPVTGDVAWAGNWFFLTDANGLALEPDRADELTDYARRVRRALNRAGVTGADGGIIDHVQLFGPPADPRNDARNFVLCPGGAYDRSPCGTGTCARLACLAADGELPAGRAWRQEGIVGTAFEARYESAGGGRILPRVTGNAYVTAEATLLFDPADPFRAGVHA